MITNSMMLQLLLAIISACWLIPYFIAFKNGSKKISTTKKNLSHNSIYTWMYYSGFFISLIWYIMPLLPQFRLQFNIQKLFVYEHTLANSLYCVVCFILMCYFFYVWGVKVVNWNLKATKDRFLYPSNLITDGPYGKVRNPMIIGDLFGHLSFILLTGALYTLYLYIIYIIIDMTIVYIENRYSIYPFFEKDFRKYSEKVPAYLNRKLFFIMIFFIVIILLNVYITYVNVYGHS